MGWNVVGYMAGIRVLLEDGMLLCMSWSIARCVAGIRVLLEYGILAGSFTGRLAVGILALIFGSFVGYLGLVARVLIAFLGL